MTEVQRSGPVQVAAELHTRGSARVWDLARRQELVVSTPGDVLAGNLAWAAGGAGVGWAVAVTALFVAGLTALAVVALALPVGFAVLLGAQEVRARTADRVALQAMRSRHRPTVQVQAGGWSLIPSPATRQQAALPQSDHSLPAAERRALP